MSQLPLFTSFAPPSWKVADLTRYLREVLESDENLQDIWVQGEVSNFSKPPSGHVYFTIKDSNASLHCVMWRNSALRLPSYPKNGDEIEVHGSIGVYEVGGQYQLYADLIRPVGEGALYQEFLRLKARLEAEGLFAPERKRPLPRWPRRIGIVTSPTGAALRDMLNTLRRRYPVVEVVLAPTPVQGEEAPPRIVAALEELNQVSHPDVILLARGGGSIEDLWAFNDERVARAVAASPAPVITGVGHETDFTIADFASDLRAPTPTAAAELATPNRADLLATLGDFHQRLRRAGAAALSGQRWELSRIENRLSLHSPRNRLRSDRQRLDEFTHRAGIALAHRLQLQKARLSGLEQRLASLNPTAILERGFAVLTDREGRTVRSARQVQPGDRLSAQVSDGRFEVEVATGGEERLR
jgi:exodeoxyribonuclease VII large subunit